MAESTSTPLLSKSLRLQTAAVLFFLSRIYTVLFFLAVPMVYFLRGYLEWPVVAGGGCLMAILLAGAYVTAGPLRCVVCGSPVLIENGSRKHAGAKKLLPGGERARVAWDILTQGSYHCMYCYSRCRSRNQWAGKAAGQPAAAGPFHGGTSTPPRITTERFAASIFGDPGAAPRLEPTASVPAPEQRPLAEVAAGATAVAPVFAGNPSAPTAPVVITKSVPPSGAVPMPPSGAIPIPRGAPVPVVVPAPPVAPAPRLAPAPLFDVPSPPAVPPPPPAMSSPAVALKSQMPHALSPMESHTPSNVMTTPASNTTPVPANPFLAAAAAVTAPTPPLPVLPMKTGFVPTVATGFVPTVATGFVPTVATGSVSTVENAQGESSGDTPARPPAVKTIDTPPFLQEFPLMNAVPAQPALPGPPPWTVAQGAPGAPLAGGSQARLSSTPVSPLRPPSRPVPTSSPQIPPLVSTEPVRVAPSAQRPGLPPPAVVQAPASPAVIVPAPAPVINSPAVREPAIHPGATTAAPQGEPAAFNLQEITGVLEDGQRMVMDAFRTLIDKLNACLAAPAPAARVPFDQPPVHSRPAAPEAVPAPEAAPAVALPRVPPVEFAPAPPVEFVPVPAPVSAPSSPQVQPPPPPISVPPAVPAHAGSAAEAVSHPIPLIPPTAPRRRFSRPGAAAMQSLQQTLDSVFDNGSAHQSNGHSPAPHRNGSAPVPPAGNAHDTAVAPAAPAAQAPVQRAADDEALPLPPFTGGPPASVPAAAFSPFGNGEPPAFEGAALWPPPVAATAPATPQGPRPAWQTPGPDSLDEPTFPAAHPDVPPPPLP